MALSVLITRRITTFLGVIGVALVLYTVYVLTTPGQFTQWTNWSECSVSCGRGVNIRTRSCTAPTPGPFGLDCEGPKTERKDCEEKPCPINGGYTEWSVFGACDKSCGGGKKTRTRTCTNPVSQHGGKTCQHLGSPEETQSCNVQPCPINGGYSSWGEYSGCELEGGKNCGKGKKVRIRTCNNPVPQHGGKPCEGPEKETADCEIPCPTLPPTTNTTSNFSNATTTPTKST